MRQGECEILFSSLVIRICARDRIVRSVKCRLWQDKIFSGTDTNRIESANGRDQEVQKYDFSNLQLDRSDRLSSAAENNGELTTVKLEVRAESYGGITRSLFVNFLF